MIFSPIFDRESISHGPTSLKIVVVVVLLGTLLKVTFNVTAQFSFAQKSQNVPKSLKKFQKSQKSPKSLKTSPKVSNSETDPLGGGDFYSFSKVGVERVIDILTSRKENKLCVSVVRSGNVIGGGDRGEDRLMTDLITSFIEKKVFQVRNKKSIRPWQYVLDSIYGYLLVGEKNLKMKQGEVFNLNSKLNNKYTVEYLIKEFEKQIQTKLKIKYSSKKFPEMSVLRLNSDKARKKLNWNTQTSLEETIEKVVGWENHYNSSKPSIEFSVLEIKSFISKNNIDYEIQKY